MTRKSWDHRGKTRQQRGYGAAWDRLRKRILARDRYLCQPCLRKGRVRQATAVDHVHPKANGGTDDEANLQAICDPCHDEKSATDRGQRRKLRPAYGADGWPLSTEEWLK